MTICPIAIAVGCKRCPIFSVCPVKSVIGDYVPPKDTKTAAPAAPRKKAAATRRASTRAKRR
jgi:hypothetical protein